MSGNLNVIGYGLAAIGPPIAAGLLFAAYISRDAGRPQSRGLLEPTAILGFGLA